MRVLGQMVGGIAVVVLLAGATMFALGTRLPEEHVAATAITIEAPQGNVWSLLEDVQGYPEWRTGVARVEMNTDHDGHRCWTEMTRRMQLPLCEEVTGAPVTRVVALVDPGMSFGGTWTFTLTALTPTSTAVSIAEHGTARSALWRFTGHYLTREDAGIRQYAQDLKAAAEKSGAASPARVPSR